MPKTTISDVEEATGMGNILITVYKYLRDTAALLGTFKNPLNIMVKQRTPNAFFTKLQTANATFSNTPIISYKNISSSKETDILTLDLVVDSNKAVVFDIIKNGTLTAASFALATNENGSATYTQIDTSATAIASGTLVGSKAIPTSDGQYLDLGQLQKFWRCEAGDTITLTATSDGNATLYIALRVNEGDLK